MGNPKYAALAALAMGHTVDAAMGYSALRLQPCASKTDAAYPYQQWEAVGGRLRLVNGLLWGNTPVPVDLIGSAVANTSLWTTPGGGTPISLDASGKPTTIAASNGLCVAAKDATPMPGTGLWLQPCASGTPAQTFVWNDLIVHQASGLCLGT